MKGTKNPLNLIRSAIYRMKNKQTIFPYYGIEAFMGRFGAGKTLGCVFKCITILEQYPECILITNTDINGISNVTYRFSSAEELVKVMSQVIEEKNVNGYVIFIDELHVVLSDLFSHSDPIFLTYLSQLRKLGIYIIGTSQLYNKLPRMVRDYLRLSGQIVFCNKILGGITILQYVDMETCEETSRINLDYKIKSYDWFFHTIQLYESYDTFAVVSQIKSLLKYDKKGSVANNGFI